MSFINWGNETPEQKEIRRRMEERMMFEQASYNAAMAAAAAAGSGKLARTKQGQTSLYVYESDTGQYYIGVMDFEKQSIPAIHNTNLKTSDGWYYDQNNYDGTYIVQDKGYCVIFSNSNYSSEHIALFFNAGGELVNKLELSTTDLSVYSTNGNFIALTDIDALKIWWFDGLKVDSYDLPEDTVYWEYLSSNLSGFYISAITGVTGNFYNVLFNDGTGFTNIVNIELIDDSFYFFDTYSNSNIFRLFKLDSITNYWQNIYYYNNSGNILNTVDVSTGEYYSRFSDVFGTGKHVDTFWNNDEYFICYYDEVAGTLLTTTHDKINYPVFIVKGQFRNNGTQYDTLSENAIISFSDNIAQDKGLFNVTYCDFLPIFDGISDLDNIYQFADNDDTKWYNYERISVSEDAIFVPVCTGTIPSQALSVIVFYQGGQYITPLIDFNDYTYFENTLLGNRYMIDAWYDTDLLPGKYFIFNKTGDSYLEFEYSNRNSNYYEYERDLIVWRNSSDISQMAYYLTTEDSIPFIANELPAFGLVQSTSTYKADTNTYPGNLLIQSGTGRRLYLFNDMGINNISDGGDDMYDTGNILSTNLDNEIEYTHTQMTIILDVFDETNEATPSLFMMDGEIVNSDSQFGIGSQYFTNLYPGLFTMVAKNITISDFYIEGSTGIDGAGYNTTDKYEVSIGDNNYTAFLKTTTGGGNDMQGESDPTINQIIIVNSQNILLTQEINNDPVDTDSDYHKIGGLDTSSVTDVHYLLMSTYNGSVQQGFITADFHNVVDAYLGIVDNLSLSETLTALNTDYELVTSEIINDASYTLTLIKNDDTVVEESSVFYDEGLDLGPTMCAGSYHNEDGLVCVDVYNLDLELISTYISNETDLTTVRIIDNRLYIVTEYLDNTVIAIMNGTSFIRKDFTNNNSWRSSNDYAAWY